MMSSRSNPQRAPEPVAPVITPVHIEDPRYHPDLGIYGMHDPRGYTWVKCQGGDPESTKAALLAAGIPPLRRDDVRTAYQRFPAPNDSAGLCSVSFPCIESNGDPWCPNIIQITAIISQGRLITIAEKPCAAIALVDSEREKGTLSPHGQEPGSHSHCDEWRNPADLAVRILGSCVHRIEDLVDEVLAAGNREFLRIQDRSDHVALARINALQERMGSFQRQIFGQVCTALEALYTYGQEHGGASSKIKTYQAQMTSARQKFETFRDKLVGFEDSVQDRIALDTARQGFELNVLLAAFVPISVGLGVGGINMSSPWTFGEVASIVGSSVLISAALLAPHWRELRQYMRRLFKNGDSRNP